MKSIRINCLGPRDNMYVVKERRSFTPGTELQSFNPKACHFNDGLDHARNWNISANLGYENNCKSGFDPRHRQRFHCLLLLLLSLLLLLLLYSSLNLYSKN